MHSQAETARYLAVLPRYKQAPKVTRERLYLETIEHVLDHSTKMLVAMKGSNNMLYLPIDKWIRDNNRSIKRKIENSNDTDTTQTQSDDTSPYLQAREGYPTGQD